MAYRRFEYMTKRPFSSICTSPLKESRARGETEEGNIKEYFDKLGADGWEMCGTGEYGRFFFKRELPAL